MCCATSTTEIQNRCQELSGNASLKSTLTSALLLSQTSCSQGKFLSAYSSVLIIFQTEIQTLILQPYTIASEALLVSTGMSLNIPFANSIQRHGF